MPKRIFKKIKLLSDKVEIDWKFPLKDNAFGHQTLSLPDTPKPAFLKVLTDLKPHLQSLGECGSLDKKRCTVSGVSLSYKGEDSIMNVVITGKYTYMNSPGCQALNTPVKPVKKTGAEPTAEANLLSEECAKLVKSLIKQADAYIDGERSEIPLLGDDDEKAETDKKGK